jgi:hypothetical protein
MPRDKKIMGIILAMLLGVILILTGSYLFLIVYSFHGFF